MSKKRPTITLLISTYNWLEALKKVLEGVERQTVMPDEIVIADDGSGEDTVSFVQQYAKTSCVPVRHVWHEDKGFRRSMILNKAVASATGDYIIEMDGDVIPERHFVEDHICVARRGYFVCGGRVMLKEDGRISPSHYFNCIRSMVLRALVLRCNTEYNVRHIKGCNMAFWRDDFIAVNGYDEAMEGWGSEDHEFTSRLLFAGVKYHRLKFGGVLYHLYHKAASKENAEKNREIFRKVWLERKTWTEDGVNKYLG